MTISAISMKKFLKHIVSEDVQIQVDQSFDFINPKQILKANK